MNQQQCPIWQEQNSNSQVPQHIADQHINFCNVNYAQCYCGEAVHVSQMLQHRNDYHGIRQCEFCFIHIETWALSQHECEPDVYMCQQCHLLIYQWEEYEQHITQCETRGHSPPPELAISPPRHIGHRSQQQVLLVERRYTDPLPRGNETRNRSPPPYRDPPSPVHSHHIRDH